jgi:hypothetical protein
LRKAWITVSSGWVLEFQEAGYGGLGNGGGDEVVAVERWLGVDPPRVELPLTKARGM